MIYAEAAGIERQEAATTAYKVYDGHVLRFSSENLDDAMNEAFKLVKEEKKYIDVYEQSLISSLEPSDCLKAMREVV